MSSPLKRPFQPLLKIKILPIIPLLLFAAVVSGIITLTYKHSHATANLVGDLNGDGVVNITDLSILLSAWGSTNSTADLNSDGVVNITDLSMLLSNWGGTAVSQTCPSPSPVAPVTGYVINQCEDFNNGLGSFNAYSGGGGSDEVGPGRVASQCQVSNGILHELQSSDGTTCGGSMPTFAHLQGLWEVRMRAYSTGTSGSAPHPVLILWPDTGVHADGELDYFETDMGNPAHGYLHCVGANYAQSCFNIPNSPVDYSQWHVYSFLWTGNSMTGYIDGQQWWTTTGTSFVPTVSMHQTIQLDNLSGTTPVKAGEMDIDWVHLFVPGS